MQVFIEPMIKVSAAIGFLMTAAAYLVLLERRMAAWVQDRVGPNRVGIPLTKISLFGLGQPLADGLKFILKEETSPAHVDYRLFITAPVVILGAALAVFAVVPFGSYLPTLPWVDNDPIPLVVAPGINVGLVYVFALSSIAVYGVIVGGWASNNKYSFLGGLRSSAQLIAYELPMGLGILGVALSARSLMLEEIIDYQAQSGVWLLFVQPLGFLVFLVAAFAEASRLPFDLPECEQELIGGYHTEYAGLKLLLFLVAEFLHMVLAAYLIAILFLGGWHLWGITGGPDADPTWLNFALRVTVLHAKVMVVVLFFMLVRWSWPRFRFDQLMSLGWKIMLPLGMVNFVVLAILYEIEAMNGGMLFSSTIMWTLTLVAVSWGTLFGSAAVVAWTSPLLTDNAPRMNINLEGIDAQI